MTCPDDETLIALAEHTLPASELAAIEEHVAGCADCRSLIGHVASGETAAAPEDEERRRVGRYELERVLGSGGMGTVWEAWDPMLERRVAIKVLHEDVEEQHGERLLREARALAKLQHPHVVAIHDVGEFEHRVFIATELVDGESLDKWQADRTPQELCAAYAQAARGLAAAHAIGLVHRDVKPANILVGRDRRVRVGDFGLVVDDARQGGQAAARLTRSGHVVGTPAYMAPEQRTRAAIDARADQYSLCLALAEALLGKRPPFETSAKQLAELGVPGPWETIARGLSTKPSERFEDIEEVASALEEFAGDELVAPRRTSSPNPSGRQEPAKPDPRITIPQRTRGRESSRQVAATVPERPGTTARRALVRGEQSGEQTVDGLVARRRAEKVSGEQAAHGPTSLATTTERSSRSPAEEPPRRESARTPAAFAETHLAEEPRRAAPRPSQQAIEKRSRRGLLLVAGAGATLAGGALVWRLASGGSSTTEAPPPTSDLLARQLLVAADQRDRGQSDACLATLGSADLAAYQRDAELVKMRATCAMASGNCDAADDIAGMTPAGELEALRRRTSCVKLDGDGKLRIAELRKLAKEPALWDRRCKYVDREVRALIVRRDVEPDNRAILDVTTRALRCWGRLGKCDEARALLDTARLSIVRVQAADVPECKLSAPPDFAIEFLDNARIELEQTPFYPLAAARFELAYARLQIPEVAFEAAQAYHEAFQTARKKATVAERRAAYRARAIALYDVYLKRRPDGANRGVAFTQQRGLEDAPAPPSNGFTISEPTVDAELDRAIDFPAGEPCRLARGIVSDILECTFADQRPHGLRADMFGGVPATCPQIAKLLLAKRKELGCE